jgi:CheY-like chemotaxis protein
LTKCAKYDRIQPDKTPKGSSTPKGNRTVKIAIIEDNEKDLIGLILALTGAGHEVMNQIKEDWPSLLWNNSLDLSVVTEAVGKFQPDVILLDEKLGREDKGSRVLLHLKSQPWWNNPKVVGISSEEQEGLDACWPYKGALQDGNAKVNDDLDELLQSLF